LFPKTESQEGKKKLTDEPRNPENRPYESAPFVDSGHEFRGGLPGLSSLFGLLARRAAEHDFKDELRRHWHTQTQTERIEHDVVSTSNARFSSDNQKDASIEDQVRLLAAKRQRSKGGRSSTFTR